MVSVVGSVFLGAARLLAPSARPVSLTSVLVGPAVVAVLTLGLYLLTRRFTNRTAAALQREIDALDRDPKVHRKLTHPARNLADETSTTSVAVRNV
jgi:hypothetical protein